MSKFQIIIFVAIFSACSIKSDRNHEPKKPVSIPENAFWVGGVDGGNWYLVHSIHDHRNTAIISVYDEIGDLIIKKKFDVICRVDRPAIWIKNLEQQINGFDGKKIMLKSQTGNEICWMQ